MKAKFKIFVALLVTVSLVSASVVITKKIVKYNKNNAKNEIIKSKPLVKKINKNAWLKSDFEQILSFYNSQTLHFDVEYRITAEGATTPASIIKASIWTQDGNYLYKAEDNEVLRNNFISLMVDKKSKTILVDSAWDAAAILPGVVNLDTSLMDFDSIQRVTKGDYYIYTFPSNNGLVQYSTLEVNKNDFSVHRMLIVGKILNEDINSKKPATVEIIFKNVSNTKVNNTDLFSTNRYLSKSLPSPIPNGLYNGYKVITRNDN